MRIVIQIRQGTSCGYVDVRIPYNSWGFFGVLISTIVLF
jgi:hypothetical protein